MIIYLVVELLLLVVVVVLVVAVLMLVVDYLDGVLQLLNNYNHRNYSLILRVHWVHK